MCCFAFIEFEEYFLNDYRFLGCLRRSNNPLCITIRFINSELQTTQPQQPTEVNALNRCFVDLYGLDTTSPFLFSYGLDETSPFFFSPWSGCNQSIFLFSVVWMQPVHLSFFCTWSGLFWPILFCAWSGISGPFLSTQSP